MVDLSVIIVSFNTKKLLDTCLSSVYASLADVDFSYEVIVIDNASTDGSVELLKNKYTRVVKIFNNKNVGFGIANNIGILRAKGQFVLLINSDIIVHPNSIQNLFAFAKIHANDFVGGKLLNIDKTPQASCGPAYTLPVIFAVLFFRADTLHITRYSPTHVRSVSWISGACIMAAKKSFVSIGLFDEEIFMYMEEIDLLFRAKKQGHSVLFYPDAQFTHIGAASSKDKGTPVVNIYHGLWYFYRKHRSKFAQNVLMILLLLKAKTAVFFAMLTGNRRLRQTYESALNVVTA